MTNTGKYGELFANPNPWGCWECNGTREEELHQDHHCTFDLTEGVAQLTRVGTLTLTAEDQRLRSAPGRRTNQRRR